MLRSTFRLCASIVLLGAAPIVPSLAAQEATGPDRAAYDTAVEKGIAYLAQSGQAEDGSFSRQIGSGPTSLAVTAMLRHGRPVQDPAVAKGLEYLAGLAQEDGGIYAPKAFTKNYETCAAIMCFTSSDETTKKYAQQIEKAEAYVRGAQIDEGENVERDDYSYGGSGYGGSTRPDLSNTAFMVDALKATGAGENDEAIQKALVFVSRCQNLESQYNTTPYAAKVNDGGFYYTPVLDSRGSDRENAAGGLDSYGSMTYAGFKSMLYAGVDKDDPRVKAATAWIAKHYSVTDHPGQGNAGLYYYYHTFAKALDATGQEMLTDADGVKHDWRKELAAELIRRQQPDGSWANENERFMEGDANLATAFALLALDYCRPKQASAASE